MKALPVVVLLGAAACLGVILGLNYLRGVRSRPGMIGIHFLLGAGGLEILVMLLNRTPDGETMPAGPVATTAAGLVALALFVGVLTPMIGRRSRRTMNVALATHAGIASTALVVLAVWVARLIW
jgi:hypothetical protein